MTATATQSYAHRERTLTAWPVPREPSFQERWPNTTALLFAEWERQTRCAAYRVARQVLREYGVQAPNSLAALIARGMMQSLDATSPPVDR